MTNKKEKAFNSSFHFKIGSFNCMVVRDSVSIMELETFYPDKTPTQLEQLLHQYSIPHQETMETMCLFIRTEKNTVLIDTGWGTWSQTYSGKLIQNLQAEGIQATEIDTVILSHGHPDHIGGITDAEGKPAFPNARYFIHKKECDFWASEPDLPQLEENIRQEILTVVHKNLIPLRDQYELLENDKGFIIDGIEYIRAPGHTPGHIVLVVSSNAERLLCICDLVHHPLEFALPDLRTPFDIIPKQVSLSRIGIFSRIAASGSLVFACHLPFPGLGHIIERARNVWLWQPIAIDDNSSI